MARVNVVESKCRNIVGPIAVITNPLITNLLMTNPLMTNPLRLSYQIYFLWLLATGIWLLMIIAPAYLAVDYPVASGLMRWPFAAICHQIPARSLWLWQHPLAVCARCMGIYSGFFVGLNSYFLIYPRSFSSTLPARRYLLYALLPTTLDFLYGWLGWGQNTTLSRTLTGSIAGAGLAYYLLPLSLYLAAECYHDHYQLKSNPENNST
jgi:uncharacterized membrane protein